MVNNGHNWLHWSKNGCLDKKRFNFICGRDSQTGLLISRWFDQRVYEKMSNLFNYKYIFGNKLYINWSKTKFMLLTGRITKVIKPCCNFEFQRILENIFDF